MEEIENAKMKLEVGLDETGKQIGGPAETSLFQSY